MIEVSTSISDEAPGDGIVDGVCHGELVGEKFSMARFHDSSVYLFSICCSHPFVFDDEHCSAARKRASLGRMSMFSGVARDSIDSDVEIFFVGEFVGSFLVI